jgi:SOS-response transcriptional repressor LexA
VLDGTQRGLTAMPTDHRAALANIKRFDQLIAYLRDEMGWPIDRIEIDDLMFEYTPEELGIDPKNAAKIEEIKRLRPLSAKQPWGIFFVKFEPKRLPVVALRRILGQVVLKKRTSSKAAERAKWDAGDLLFISNYGEGGSRQISFAHFSQSEKKHDLPTLKVLDWNELDTESHLDDIALHLTQHLSWPADDGDIEVWRRQWRSAFTLGHREVISTSKQLAIALAKLARRIRHQIKEALDIETERGKFTKLMNAFRDALVHDLDADSFADMYAQTITYGLLSARIADPTSNTADDFASHMRTNPFLKELMETFLRLGGRGAKAGGPGIDFDEVGVNDVVDLLDHANITAVVRDFGDRNPQEDPVIHFYELFAKEYDPAERIKRGVFYTPRPVVSYIVRSVDGVLRTEFGLRDGLADVTTWGEMAKRHSDLAIPDGVAPDQPFVQILDPAAGTGTFLVEVINLIHQTLIEKWKARGHDDKKVEALWNDYVPEYLLTRVHGYELLMAPYAIAHLKIGLKLWETGYRFGSDERARVFLTNSLEPPTDVQFRISAMPALAHEAQAVNEIKRKQRFTVVLGNPPYAGISPNMTRDVQHIVDAYRVVDGAALNERKLWLQDDYVKFMRVAQVTITRCGAGVLGYITNHAYLDNPTFRGMRQSLLSSFERLRFLDLHGNTTKKEKSPDGSKDENVFDIRQGVAICLASSAGGERLCQHEDLWGSRERKYGWLLTHDLSTTELNSLTPTSPFYFFEPQNVEFQQEYNAFWRITDVMPSNTTGFVTARDHFVIDFDSDELLARVKEFRSANISDDVIRRRYFAGKGSDKYEEGDSRGWKLHDARERVRSDADWASRVVDCLYRPFDVRKIYWCDWMVDWPRPEVTRHLLGAENFAINIGRAGQVIDQGHWNILFCTKWVTEFNLFRRGGNSIFPLWLYESDSGSQGGIATSELHRRPNLNPSFLHGLFAAVGVNSARYEDVRAEITAKDVFHYSYALLSSPSYRKRYAEFLKSDFPRLPLPGSVGVFRDLARLGGELILLHLMESPELEDLVTTYIGPKNAQVQCVAWSDHTVWIDAEAAKKRQRVKSGSIGFRGVAEEVWNFQIGGYQICEKWLKDRKGRALSDVDIIHYQMIVVAISKTLGLMKDVDGVIEQYGGWPGAFQTHGSEEVVHAKAVRLQIVPHPSAEQRYVTCVPLVPLKAAAGAFSDPQHVEDRNWEWVEIDSRHRLRSGMFVAQVLGHSMEPLIPDGAFCLFASPVVGTRQGKTVLVQLRDAIDPETGERYTVKRYESEKVDIDGSWRHARIRLKPINPEFAPLDFAESPEGRMQVIAELIEVIPQS